MEDELLEWRRSRTRLLQRLRVVPLITFIALVLGGALYVRYDRYTPRFLMEAEARLSIDDREGAISALRSHIWANPDDYETQIRLADLVKEIRDLDSAKRIYERIIENTDGRLRFPLLYEFAANNLALLIGERSDELKQKVEDAIRVKDYKKAIELCDRLTTLCAENPYLGNRREVPSGENDDLDKLSRQAALESYDQAIALKAYAQWRFGSADEFEETLGSWGHPEVIFASPPEYNFKKQRRKLLASFIATYASELVYQNKWEEAASAFGSAKEQRLKALDGKYDDEVGKLQYNQAFSKYNGKRYWTAWRQLKDLQAKLPEYARTRVEDLLLQSGKAARMRKYERIRSDQAHLN